MYDNEYFVVDMATCTSTGEIINNLSLALETLNDSGKKIVLKLNECHLNQSQLLSIQSLITSCGCTLDTIETLNDETRKVAESMNIFVQKPIEKRVEDKYESSSNFELFSAQTSDALSIKDVNGLHFEADLDSIKQQQDSIDIEADLEKFRVQEIEKKLEKEKLERQKEKELVSINQTVKAENDAKAMDELLAMAEPENASEDVDGNKLNSISVYKKAYDESTVTNNDWEDVDFYESPTDEAVVSDTKVTTYINQTLRSGQILESEGNVVVIGDCHPGSEIRAVGDITVWGVLSGIAHAGIKGNLEAKVRALKLNAVQLRIANCYSRRPDDTNIPYIIRSSVFTPEEARVVDGEIMLFKINQN